MSLRPQVKEVWSPHVASASYARPASSTGVCDRRDDLYHLAWLDHYRVTSTVPRHPRPDGSAKFCSRRGRLGEQRPRRSVRGAFKSQAVDGLRLAAGKTNAVSDIRVKDSPSCADRADCRRRARAPGFVPSMPWLVARRLSDASPPRCGRPIAAANERLRLPICGRRPASRNSSLLRPRRQPGARTPRVWGRNRQDCG
jgi:hypothetical protein